MEIWHTKEEKPDNNRVIIYELQELIGSCIIYSYYNDFPRCDRWCYLEDYRKQLQVKDREIKELNEKIGKDNVVDYHYHRKREFELLKEIEELKNKENRSDGIIGGLLNEGKSLQTKLQQAKEGLEFYAKAKHFEEHSHYDIMLEWGEKARETLEIINKEQDKREVQDEN